MAILNLTFLLTLAFLIFATMSAVHGLKCFNCTVDELNQLAKQEGGECSGESVECHPKEVCVKVIDKGFGRNDGSKSSTTRHCLPEGRYNATDVDKCQDKEGFGDLFHMCICTTDNCNRSGLLQPSSLSSIFILAIIGVATAIYQIIQ